jgi:TolB-like protein
MQRERTPFDSLAVIARHDGSALAAAIAEVLSEDLAATIGRCDRLRVPRAEFVQPYAKSELTAEEVGRALNVRAVALCTIATANGSVDATVELIDVLHEELIAAESFLVSARELLALQRAMAHVIAPELTRWQPVMTDEGVYARIVQARAAGNAEDALAILDGADCPLEIASTIVEGGVRARIGEARSALRDVCSVRALQLRAKLAFRFDADWPAAEDALREALELNPCSPSTRSMLGDLLVATGRPAEGAPHQRLAAEQMPLDERAQIAVAFADYFGAFPLNAVAHFREVGADEWLVRALLAGGDVMRAREAANTPFACALVAAFARDSVYAAPFDAHKRALIFSAAGAVEDAVACLESCADDARFFAAVEPLFLPLAASARFGALLSKFFPSASHRIYLPRNRSCGGDL